MRLPSYNYIRGRAAIFGAVVPILAVLLEAGEPEGIPFLTTVCSAFGCGVLMEPIEVPMLEVFTEELELLLVPALDIFFGTPVILTVCSAFGCGVAMDPIEVPMLPVLMELVLDF